MWKRIITFALGGALLASPVAALNEGLQCVPYARALSGVQIKGDAHTWWGQAAGLYDRGSMPRVGSVMAFRPHGGMRLGHVAAVRKIVDSRTVLVSHANWSTIGGVRGHIENDVRVEDASEANDWSRVKVWYSPNAAMGTTEWPLYGFIYPAKQRSWGDAKVAVTALLGGRVPTAAPSSAAPVPTRTALAILPPKPSTTGKSAPGFSLSWGLKSDIEKAAKVEAKLRR
jgi:surface antigen